MEVLLGAEKAAKQEKHLFDDAIFIFVRLYHQRNLESEGRMYKSWVIQCYLN